MTAMWERIQHVVKYIRIFAILVLLVWCGFTMINTGTIAFNGATLPPIDPFADYADLLPGQISTTLDRFRFICSVSSARYSQTKYCSHQPDDGAFSLVEVFVDQHDKITEIDFTLRNGLFKVGDLMLLWGKPSVHPHPTLINFIWDNGAGATTQFSRHISFSLDVQKVYFMLNKERIRPNRADEW